jgi:hypothetical protein
MKNAVGSRVSGMRQRKEKDIVTPSESPRRQAHICQRLGIGKSTNYCFNPVNGSWEIDAACG